MPVTAGIHPDTFETTLFDKPTGSSRPFASITAHEGDGTVTLYLVTAAQCDELIEATAAAKSMLLAAGEGEGK